MKKFSCLLVLLFPFQSIAETRFDPKDESIITSLMFSDQEIAGAGNQVLKKLKPGQDCQIQGSKGDPLSAKNQKGTLKKIDYVSCQLILGWGHCSNAKDALEDQKANGIGMGCNSGEAGVGDLKNQKDWWRFQRGSNGTYALHRQQGTQNGGLNPVIFETADLLGDQMDPVANANSRIGFMRLTQYHWLKLHQYAIEKLLSKTCSEVKLKYECVDQEDDLDDEEYKIRKNSFHAKLEIPDEALKVKYQKEIEIISRFEPLKNCFEGASHSPVPEKCGQTVVLTEKVKLKSHCQKWVKEVDEMPQHDWKMPSNLPRPSSYSYPAQGSIN